MHRTLLRQLFFLGVGGGPELRAELVFQDFTGAAFGEGVSLDDETAGEFEFAKVLASGFEEMLLGNGGVCGDDDDRYGDLSPPGVGGGDDGALEDAVMAEERMLDFDGRDIFAAADDDVFLAVDDAEGFFGRPDGHVAGVQPAVDDGFAGELGGAIVAVHDLVAADD